MYAAEMSAALAYSVRVLLGRHVLVQPKSLTAHGDGQKKKQNRPLYSYLHEVDQLLRACDWR